MANRLVEPCCFGADNKPSCPNCRSTMGLKSRRPDATYGLRYERQTFRCATCDLGIERSVDTEGKPPELLRY
jgi:transposase-like protein